MDRCEVETLLEALFLTYKELVSVPVVECGQDMVPLTAAFGVRACPINKDMEPYTGDAIWVRRGVAERLQKAQEALQVFLPEAVIEVVYGYRHPDIQQRSFEAIRQKLLLGQRFENEESLKERAHIYVAVPEVAGHPTGGAVDVRLRGPEGLYDMGTQAHDFCALSYALSPFVDKEVWFRRQYLRMAMTAAGFVPFDGEWWHFSYGDREWARFTGATAAFYGPVSLCCERRG